MLELDENWVNRLIASIKYCDAYAVGQTGKVQRGLFRVPASGEVLNDLKERIRNTSSVDEAFKLLEDFHSEAADKEEGMNAIASLLKWILRELPVPLLPFDHASTDVSAYRYQEVTDEEDKGRLGCQFAQDLILTMATQLRDYDEKVVSQAIAAVGQLLAMMCTVARSKEIEMTPYNLSVPFLPSLCNSRDPTQLMKEHTDLQAMNDKRNVALSEVNSGNAEMSSVPITKLEVFILYGHRIWGYIKHALPSLEQAMVALMQETHEPEHKIRKRDALKRLLNKMSRSGRRSSARKRQEAAAGDDTAKSSNIFQRMFTRKHSPTSDKSKPSKTEEGDISELGQLSIIQNSDKVSEEDRQRLGINHVKSVRLESPLTTRKRLNHNTTEEVKTVAKTVSSSTRMVYNEDDEGDDIDAVPAPTQVKSLPKVPSADYAKRKSTRFDASRLTDTGAPVELRNYSSE